MTTVRTLHLFTSARSERISSHLRSLSATSPPFFTAALRCKKCNIAMDWIYRGNGHGRIHGGPPGAPGLVAQRGRRNRAAGAEARHEAVGHHRAGAEPGDLRGVPQWQAVPHALAEPPRPGDQEGALERAGGADHLRGAAAAGQQVGRDREAPPRQDRQRHQEPLVLDDAP